MSLHGLTTLELRALSGSEPVASLPLVLRHEICRLSVVRRYVNGDWIAASGETATDWFCCVGGSVRVSSGHGRGRDAVLTYLQPGDWFGEMALIGALEQPHDCVAHGATTVAALPGHVFTRLLEGAPDFSAALLRLQVKKARTLFSVIEDWRGLQLKPRVAKQLIRLAGVGNAVATLSRRGECLHVGLTQGELARVVGASRQRVNHVLKTMERERLIKSGYDGIQIEDLEGLNSLWRNAGRAQKTHLTRSI